jgi:DNA repair protein RadD
MILRNYQEEFLNKLRKSFLRNKNILGVLPTGAGKTVIISAITQLAQQKGNRVYIFAHRIELIEQISSALHAFNIPHNLVLPDYPVNNNILVQVCSVDTFIRRVNNYLPPDLIIVDEAHHLASATNKWGRCVSNFPNARILGLTATPVRTNGQGLGRNSGGLFDDLIVGCSVEWLIQNGYLTDIRYFVPPQIVDMTGVRTLGGDYDQNELEERLNQSIVTGDAIAHYARICPHAPAIAFCASIRHAQAVAAEFSANGFSSDVIHGGLDKVTRKNLISGLAKREINVLTSVNVISEGTDIPIVEAGIILRPTQSLALHLQIVGRIPRIAEGKKFAFLNDHVGNTLRHGFADTPREWTLAGTKKSRKDQEPTIPMKQCPNCFCCHKPAPACPSCGHKYKTEIKKLKTEKGELQELSKEERELIKIRQKREIKKADSLNELKEIEKKRGFKKGWADHVWAGKLLAREKYNAQRG